ncbi:hypothetical protein DWV06_00550 [Anaerosacchariphilus polymeriproducens]|uniref:Ig-like domain-containing protein n=2 Tax=Anaerosacchariphilus polymeriproducens TaxID=1812858 RepID=A0A371B071_9FIRM|nr:hypothetical protein DWV06_00550 [Anaerosacchariphilus polymeriproducens]
MTIPEKVSGKDQAGNDLYQGDVTVDCAFRDSLSGLAKVTYQVEEVETGNVTQEETIVIGEEGTIRQGSAQIVEKDENLVTELAKSIKVTNNRNNIKVRAVFTDRAGYETREERTFSIDKTAPVLAVTYDNNSYDKEFESETQYYKEGRTATLTVTERNFNEADAKVTVTNSEGSAPTISGWTKHENRQDPDQTTYTATISYQQEGDYTFAMSFEDLAGNQAADIPQQKFTVDTTAPVIEVTYDNNQAQRETFYKEGRTATVTIREHNFETSRIKTVLKAKDQGAAPGISSFTSNGDVHTASIRFEDDQVYTFDIDYTDKAGNQAADLKEITFCVDKTKPALTVTGIKNHSANSGRDADKKETNVGFVLEASDENFAGLTPHLNLVTLEGIKNCDNLLGSAQAVENGQRYAVSNLKKDGIYLLTATVTDQAGNENKAAKVTEADGRVQEAEQIVFSVNRNGSVYTLDEATRKINGSYLTKEQDIVIQETNVNSLKERTLTLFQDNQTKSLKEGEDYQIQKTEGNGQWNQYTYQIYKKNFSNDGYYSLALYSVDAADNKSENNMDTKDVELRFAVDKTAPKVIVTNLSDREAYQEEKKDVTMVIDDNMKLQEVKVYHSTYNGNASDSSYGEAAETWDNEKIQQMVSGKEDFTFPIDGNTTQKHKVKIVAVDAAGTQKEVEVKDFYVTKSWIIGVKTQGKKALPIAGGVLLLGGLGAGVVFVLRKRKAVNVK